MIEFFIAKRHILERKRQSIIAILGVVIGITVLTVSLGISNGLNKNMVGSILSMSSHIDVNNQGEVLTRYKEISEEIGKIKGVKGVVSKIETQGILKYNGVYGSYVSGVKVQGLDFKAAEDGMGLKKKIVKGTMESKNLTDFLIGKELFDQLNANIGDTVTLVSADNREMKLKIGGVFQSGYYDYDTTMILLPLRTVQILTYQGDIATGIDVFLNDIYKAPKKAQEIKARTGLNTVTWGEQNKNLLSALSLEQTGMILVFSLIIIIAGFVVWVILNMMVKEKTRDIGIMRSMGFSTRRIMKIFLLEGLVLGILGLIIGLIISGGILLYLKDNTISEISKIYYLTKIPVELSLREVGIIVLANIVVIFVSSIFPAYKAGKLEVVDALKHD